MKAILLVFALLTGSYALINWAGDNPRDARRVTRQVDDAANTIVDKSKRAVDEIKK
jgi:hypothetical protein